MNTVVDTVVQHQVENIHVMRPTVAAWHRCCKLSLGMQDFLRQKKEHKDVKCQKNSRFDSIQRTNPLWCWSSLKNLFSTCHFSVVPCFTRCIKWFKEGSLSFRSVCSTCPRSGWRSMTKKIQLPPGGSSKNGTHFFWGSNFQCKCMVMLDKFPLQ